MLANKSANILPPCHTTSFYHAYIAMNNPLINPGLGTFFWMLVSFAILVFILGKWGWPMLLKALQKREEYITDQLHKAEEAEQRMQQLVTHNDEILRQAKAERDEIINNAKLTAQNIIEDAQRKAAEETDRIVENARKNIEYEKLRAMHDLKNEIAGLSINIAEKLMQQELSDKEKSNSLITRELEKAHLN